MSKLFSAFLIVLFTINYSCQSKPENNQTSKLMTNVISTDTAIFGGGCFWCTEAVFKEVKGVVSVKSGYSGGSTENPTYNEVCSGTTGHAEVIRIIYNPEEVDFKTLLAIFFKTHDPTTLNRQGADVGTQYRSVVFYTSNEQKETTEQIIKALNDEGAYPNPIVTEVSPLTTFYKAEDYHQDYYENNKAQGYCQFVIQPKLDKFRKVFEEYLK
jgi:peptide-methionine (S)-S-oxide reductase